MLVLSTVSGIIKVNNTWSIVALTGFSSFEDLTEQCISFFLSFSTEWDIFFFNVGVLCQAVDILSSGHQSLELFTLFVVF